LEAELKRREEEERLKKEREERKRLQELRKKEEKEKRREQRRREAEERKMEEEARKQEERERLERQKLEEQQRLEMERKREEEVSRMEKQKKAEALSSMERAKKEQEQIALARQRSMEMEMTRSVKDRKSKEVCVADKVAYSPRAVEFRQPAPPKVETSQMFGDDYFNKNPIMKERSPLFQKASPMDSYMESNDMTSSVRVFFQNAVASTNGLDPLGINFSQDRSPPLPRIETSKLGVPLQPLDAKAEVNNLFGQRKEYDPAREAFNRVGTKSKWNGMPIGFDPNSSRETFDQSNVGAITEDLRAMRMKESRQPDVHDPWIVPPGFNSKNAPRFEQPNQPVAPVPPGFGANRMDLANQGPMGGFSNGASAYQAPPQYGFSNNTMGNFSPHPFPSQPSYGQHGFSNNVQEQSFGNVNHSGYGNSTPPGFGRAMNSPTVFNPQLNTNVNNGFNANISPTSYMMNTARGAVPTPTAWNEMAWNDPRRTTPGPTGGSRKQEFTFR
jgi:hypothetical protein